MMGAVFYSQAVDNYLDEKMEADNKPNNKPYKKGAHYTGKEHSWMRPLDILVLQLMQ